MRELLAQLEGQASDSLLLSLAWLAGREVALDEDELRGALRRAELLLAAGGDPRREPEPDGRAASALAADLDTPAGRAALAGALERLHGGTAGLAAVDAALTRLRQEPELAWRLYACALLADAATNAD